MTATVAVPTTVDTLLAKAKDRTAVFGIVGLGYVGLPLAMEIVRAGYRVIGFDVNSRVVDSLNGGRSHIQDVPATAVADAVNTKKFSATADLSRLKEPDVISISVPTPLSKTKDPDVSYVLAATESVRGALRKGQLVVL
jgi:UDP-N-acetyl-D-glucosamine dehydrogenase